MSNSLYDKLKFLAQVLLPVLGTLYFIVAGILDLPAAEQVVGVIVIIDTFLGVVLHISTTKYQGSPGGDLVVKEIGDKKIFSLELNDDPELLEKRNEVTFRIKRSS